MGGLLLEEARGQHPPCSVIDEGDQTALARSPLEPIVVAAVDLHQLAQAGPARPGAVHTRGTTLLGTPQTSRHHPAAQRLHAEAKAVIALQVLVRQLRAEVRIALTNQVQVTLAQR